MHGTVAGMSVLPMPRTARETLARLSVLGEDINLLQSEMSALRAHLLTFADSPPTLSGEIGANPTAPLPACSAQQTTL